MPKNSTGTFSLKFLRLVQEPRKHISERSRPEFCRTERRSSGRGNLRRDSRTGIRGKTGNGGVRKKLPSSPLELRFILSVMQYRLSLLFSSRLIHSRCALPTVRTSTTHKELIDPPSGKSEECVLSRRHSDTPRCLDPEV